MIFYNYIICPFQIFLYFAIMNTQSARAILMNRTSPDFGETSIFMIYFFVTMASVFYILPQFLLISNLLKQKLIIRLLRKMTNNAKIFGLKYSKLKCRIIFYFTVLFSISLSIRIFGFNTIMQMRIESFLFFFFVTVNENLPYFIVLIALIFLDFLSETYQAIGTQFGMKTSNLLHDEIDELCTHIANIFDIYKLFYQSYGVQISVSLCIILFDFVGRVR